MKSEWKKFWRESAKSGRGLPVALGSATIMYLISLPDIPVDERLRELWISLAYGFIIFWCVWTMYILAWAYSTARAIKTGQWVRFNMAFHGSLAFVGMALGLVLTRYVLAWVFHRPVDLSGMRMSLAVGSMFSLFFIYRYGYKHSVKENAELKAARESAELHVLKNQMQPHFLFNSLNSLSELIASDKSQAANMTQKLADLYREILENSKLQVASVASEISIITNYLELEKLRFGERLHYRIDVPPDSANIYIPSLVLQTLVENAVKHAISKSIDGGKIEVRIREGAGGYTAEVINTGSGEIAKGSGGTGIGNTRSRLQLLYGDAHKFALSIRDGRAHVSFWFSGARIAS